MNTKELESCLHFIGYWLNGDQAVIDKILKSETQFIKHFVEPFSKELNANLLNKDTIEAKRNLIKYYVFEFWELQGFYKECNEILCTGSLCNYTPVFYEHTNENGTVKKLNEFENYVVNSWVIFNMLFDEIQLSCIKYKIDFLKLCNELNFSIEYFDSGITCAFEEIQKENLPPQHPEPTAPQETPTFTNNFDNITTVEIYKHFKAGLVQKQYLTEQELNEYLKAAFELKTIPETLFKLKHTPTKQKIYTVFYIYYKDISQKKHERQKEYAALLGDFFEGYKTEIIQTNWARDYKTKR